MGRHCHCHSDVETNVLLLCGKSGLDLLTLSHRQHSVTFAPLFLAAKYPSSRHKPSTMHISTGPPSHNKLFQHRRRSLNLAEEEEKRQILQAMHRIQPPNEVGIIWREKITRKRKKCRQQKGDVRKTAEAGAEGQNPGAKKKCAGGVMINNRH